ncbi:DUF3307 domain-containing protein [Kitasatospora sp. NPDC001574]
MFAEVFILLFVAHHLGDYPFQSDHIAKHKADRTAEGWHANLTHVGAHLATTWGLFFVAGVTLDFRPDTAATFAATAWIGLTHGFIDRRWPITWWMEKTGQAGYLANGGALNVDQAAHIGLGLLPAALLIAGLS